MDKTNARTAVYQRPFKTHEAAMWMGISERQLLTFAKQLAQFAGVEPDDE